MKDRSTKDTIIEQYSHKEFMEFINYMLEDKTNIYEDDTLAIEYKDGSTYYLCKEFEQGSFKKTNIKLAVLSHSTGYAYYGKAYPRIENDGRVFIDL